MAYIWLMDSFLWDNGTPKYLNGKLQIGICNKDVKFNYSHSVRLVNYIANFSSFGHKPEANENLLS